MEDRGDKVTGSDRAHAEDGTWYCVAKAFESDTKCNGAI